MKRPTIADVARAAELSVATVDRVLSGRARVRDETARKVQDAAITVGYHGTNVIRQRILAERPGMRMAVLLQKERHAFYQELKREFEAKASAVTERNVRLAVKFATSTRPEELAALLRGCMGHFDAVAATGVDHPEVTAAVQDLRNAGIPTFSLLSDFAQGVREGYFGLNNLRVGRTAGWLIANITKRPGKVGIFVGAYRYHGQELREMGVRSYLREYAPQFRMLDGQINLETRTLTDEATSDLLARHDDLVGLYVAGGGMEGAIAAFERSGAAERCTLLVHELTPESYAGLQNRSVSIVLATPVQQIVSELLSHAVGVMERGVAGTPGQRFFNATIYTPESLG